MTEIDLNPDNYIDGRSYGKGTYAEVSILKHIKNGYQVACKVISSDELQKVGLKEEDIRQEIEILETLKKIKNPTKSLLTYYGNNYKELGTNYPYSILLSVFLVSSNISSTSDR